MLQHRHKTQCALLEYLIQWVKKKILMAEKNVVMGASMGGLVACYGFARYGDWY